jgi:NADH dehydrogenase [ubiquinone] 1 alpha subcomplex assembly factor 1
MSENQISMLREKMRSVGISLLGGNSGVEGKYELGIDSIRLVNEDDIDTGKSNHRLGNVVFHA